MAVGSQGRIGKEPGNYCILGQYIIIEPDTKKNKQGMLNLQNTKLKPKAYASFHSRFHSSIPD